MNEAKRDKVFSGINNITYRIEKSNKSDSIYVKFFLEIGNIRYRRSLRFSDHDKVYTNRNAKGIVFKSAEAELSKRQKQHIKRMVLSECKKLLRSVSTYVIHTFNADKH